MDFHESLDDLLGENLGERNKQLLKFVNASDGCRNTRWRAELNVETKMTIKDEPEVSYNKQFRGNWPFREREARGSSSWGNRQQASEKCLRRTAEDSTQNYGGEAKQQ